MIYSHNNWYIKRGQAKDARSKYDLGKDVRDWKVKYAKESIKSEGLSQSKIKKITYRPFDIRHVYYTTKSRGFVGQPGYKLMRHMVAGSNLGMVYTRPMSPKYEFSVLPTKSLIDQCTVGNKSAGAGISYLAPLYLYPVKGELNFTKGAWPAGKNGRTTNLDPKFVEQLADGIGLKFVSDGKGDLEKAFGPEDIFSYIYAVFHSPTYRSRYAEFLKIDFPRVPITSNFNMFKKLCNFGDNLVALHLMESDKLNDHITTFPVSGDNAVSKVGETGKKLKDVEDGKGKLFINTTQYFDNLPEEVWNFHIGGYQVCHKWLADRKKAKRKLFTEDIEHYQKIVVALSETIKIMGQIDETINTHGGWPMKK